MNVKCKTEQHIKRIKILLNITDKHLKFKLRIANCASQKTNEMRTTGILTSNAFSFVILLASDDEHIMNFRCVCKPNTNAHNGNLFLAHQTHQTVFVLNGNKSVDGH